MSSARFERVGPWLDAALHVGAEPEEGLRVPSLSGRVASFSDDVVRPPRAGDPAPGTLRAPTPMGDDIPAGARVGVRVRLVEEDGALLFDFRDSDRAPTDAPTFRLSRRRVELASARALAMALTPDGPPTRARVAACSGRIQVESDPQSWLGADEEDEDPAVRAFATARVIDAVLGALGNAWPSRVGAGSCTLGAIVALGAVDTSGASSVVEVLPGGEGATPSREGRSAWDGAVLAPQRLADSEHPSWLRTGEQVRDASGGLGARKGGDGVERRYSVATPAWARVAIDRITNPPHGIDRAGPPQPAELLLEASDGTAARVPAWTDLALPAGSTLIVRTAGGAGHGFPGWGVDWDPDSF